MIKINNERVMGVHILLNLLGVDKDIINNNDFLKKTILDSVIKHNYTILNQAFHKFEPQGFTGILLLSESHLSFHTWPEKNCIAIDLFSCKTKENTLSVINNIKKEINHNAFEIKILNR